MTQPAFFKRMRELYEANITLSIKKNADYAHGLDAFQNFRTAEAFNRDTAEGLYFRMMDKMSRIGNGLRQDLKVLDESIEDTLSDLCNYSVILRMWIEEKKKISEVVELSDARKTDGTVHDTFSTTGATTEPVQTNPVGDSGTDKPQDYDLEESGGIVPA